MTDDEAIKICELWLESQRQRAEMLQMARSLVKAGYHDEAKVITASLTKRPVFDGATVVPAVRHLVKRARA